MGDSYRASSEKAKQIRRGIVEARPVSSSCSKNPRKWIVEYRYNFYLALFGEGKVSWYKKKFSKESSARMSANSMLTQNVIAEVRLIHPDMTVEIIKECPAH